MNYDYHDPYASVAYKEHCTFDRFCTCTSCYEHFHRDEPILAVVPDPVDVPAEVAGLLELLEELETDLNGR